MRVICGYLIRRRSIRWTWSGPGSVREPARAARSGGPGWATVAGHLAGPRPGTTARSPVPCGPSSSWPRRGASAWALGLGVRVGDAAGDGLTAVWLLAVWAGALRANRTAKAAAAMALSWVVRQVSLDRRRRPSVRLLPPGSSRRRVGSPGGEIPGRDVLLPGHSWSGRCGGYLSRMGRHCSGSQVKSPPRMAQDTFPVPPAGPARAAPSPPGRPSAGHMPPGCPPGGTSRYYPGHLRR